MGSDYHLYQVLGDTGIGLGDDGDPRMRRRVFGSATEGRFFAVFFFKIQLGRRPPDALRRLLTLWWPLTTRRLYVGSQLDPVLGIEEPDRQPARATKSGAGDREAGPAAGGPRLGPVPEDRRAGWGGSRRHNQSWFRRWGIGEPDITTAGSSAGESRNRSGSR